MKTSESCSGAFGFEEEIGVLRYYPDGDLTKGPYYLYGGCMGNLGNFHCYYEKGNLWIVGPGGQRSQWVKGSNYLQFDRGYSSQIFLGATGKPMPMTAFTQQSLGKAACTPALLALVAGKIKNGESPNYQVCANTAPFSFFAVQCTSHEKVYHPFTDAIEVDCPDGQFIQELNGRFAPGEFFSDKPNQVSWTCCEMKLPTGTYQAFAFNSPSGASVGPGGEYTLSCQLQNVQGLVQKLTWDIKADDSTMLCQQFYYLDTDLYVGIREQNYDDPNGYRPDFYFQLDFPTYQRNQTMSSETFVSSCQSSVSIVSNVSGFTSPAQLELEIQNSAQLTPEQLRAYSSVPAMQVLVESGTLFSCSPSPDGPVLLDHMNTTLCARKVPVSNGDLRRAVGAISDSGDHQLLIEKTCPALLPPAERDGRIVSSKGLSMDNFFDILKNQVGGER